MVSLPGIISLIKAAAAREQTACGGWDNAVLQVPPQA